MKTPCRPFVSTFSALVLSGFALCSSIHAQTYTTSVVVPYDPTAPSSNFNNPTIGSNTTAYTVQTGADATNFYANISAPVPTTDVGAYQFANYYITSPGKSDGLIFGVGANGSVSIFDLNTQTPLSMAATTNSGATGSTALNSISLAVSFAFLESNPFGNTFAVNPGDLVRISYSQSLGYTFVGGGGNYPAPTRLGGQFTPMNTVPEPSTWATLGLGIVGAGIVTLRRRRAA